MNIKVLIKIGDLNDKWAHKIEQDILSDVELIKAKADYRKFGEFVNSEGGFEAMSSVIRMLPKSIRQFVDYAWDGVGMWRV